MSQPKKIILNLTPQTHVRATKGDSIFFRIPRDKLRPSGLKRLLRLERYNAYKIALLAEAKSKRFSIPAHGLSVTFFLPVPKSWSKKKKKLHHGMLCQSKPDIDNLVKAFFDSLVSEDKHIASISMTKRWVDYELGWIECALTDEPMQVEIVPPAKE
jgi:Holliday junction resolvase RusA-like endonuclease